MWNMETLINPQIFTVAAFQGINSNNMGENSSRVGFFNRFRICFSQCIEASLFYIMYFWTGAESAGSQAADQTGDERRASP